MVFSRLLAARTASLSALCLGLLVGLRASPARATAPTPGYPEPVVQWGVQKGETCDDIAKALYGSARWAVLTSPESTSTAAGADWLTRVWLAVP